MTAPDLALFHLDLGPDSPESLRDVASEIIRLYHSPAPIRENLDLIQRHGLAMAQALVEIGEALRAGDDRPGPTLRRAIAALLDGSVAAEETMCIECGEPLPPGSAERGVERCLRCKAIRKPVPGPPNPPRNLNHPRPWA